ncbi:MAG TPA: ABC transporter permease, partial [Herpetosiphonaceae bacterium]
GAQAAVTYELELPPERLGEATAALNAALPGALIYNQAQVNEVFMRVFAALLAFVVATAGLACVAGGVLIANTVGLAMVERRRELGILKAVGYPSASLLLLIALENAILGLLAGGAGMAAVAVAVRLVNRLEDDAGLALRPGLAAGMIGFSIALAVCCALAVAWGPARRRPLAQLRAD